MTLFLSDLHLGSKLCRAEALCRFLASHKDHHTLYLVGDVLDLDLMMRRFPPAHLEAIELLLSFPEIIYVPGNHDAEFRAAVGVADRRIKIFNEVVYVTRGKRYLVTHGDRFDPTGLFNGPRWLRRIVSSLCTATHSKYVSGIVQRRAVGDIKKLGFDGVICGHTHHPATQLVDGIEYMNCGDWLHSYTGLIDDGKAFRLEVGDEITARVA